MIQSCQAAWRHALKILKGLGILWILSLLLVSMAQAEEVEPSEFAGVDIQEKLGQAVNLKLDFTDHNGNPVVLSQFFEKNKPVILTLNYYSCTSLCSLVLNGLSDALRELNLRPDQYKIVTLSIDPRDTPALAAGKRQNYLKHVGKDLDWSFLISKQHLNVKSLADELGFGYRYDEKTDQFAHPAVVFIMSPEGKLSRYLYGVSYKPRDVKFALIDASLGKVGSAVDRVILRCFHYDPKSGKYGPFAVGMMRVGGVLTMALLFPWVALLWVKERKKSGAYKEIGT